MKVSLLGIIFRKAPYLVNVALQTASASCSQFRLLMIAQQHTICCKCSTGILTCQSAHRKHGWETHEQELGQRCELCKRPQHRWDALERLGPTAAEIVSAHDRLCLACACSMTAVHNYRHKIGSKQSSVQGSQPFAPLQCMMPGKQGEHILHVCPKQGPQLVQGTCTQALRKAI